jgi:hypothetical protein
LAGDVIRDPRFEQEDGRIEVLHTEFAERAARRLEAVADRLEEEGRWLKLDTVSARAKELRVAAHLVRNEALAVTLAENARASAPVYKA